MITKNELSTKFLHLALVLAVAIGLGACSGGQIRDESPLVRINELRHLDDTVSLQLRIRNVNEETLDIQRIALDFASNGQELMAWDGPAPVNIAAKGTELWSIDMADDEHSRELLDSLERGEIMSLPYKLEGTIQTAESKKMRFESKGYLYPQPGKPGYFR